MKRMTRRESILTMASALAAGGAPLEASAQITPGPAIAPPTQAAGAQAEEPSDQAFEKFVDDYFDGFFQFNPASATSAGIHKYDSELPAYSQPDIHNEISRNQTALSELARIPSDSLSANNQLDATVLGSLINGRLLELADIRAWAKDPRFYNTQAGYALYTLSERISCLSVVKSGVLCPRADVRKLKQAPVDQTSKHGGVKLVVCRQTVAGDPRQFAQRRLIARNFIMYVWLRIGGKLAVIFVNARTGSAGRIELEKAVEVVIHKFFKRLVGRLLGLCASGLCGRRYGGPWRDLGRGFERRAAGRKRRRHRQN